jgi:hypothetical protein
MVEIKRLEMKYAANGAGPKFGQVACIGWAFNICGRYYFCVCSIDGSRYSEVIRIEKWEYDRVVKAPGLAYCNIALDLCMKTKGSYEIIQGKD